jgi:hypothetical protein
MLSNDNDLQNVSTLTNLCRSHLIYNLIDRLLRLPVTLPVSTASDECAFSTLKIVKTRLRNKMKDDFLANSLLVNIEGKSQKCTAMRMFLCISRAQRKEELICSEIPWFSTNFILFWSSLYIYLY